MRPKQRLHFGLRIKPNTEYLVNLVHTLPPEQEIDFELSPLKKKTRNQHKFHCLHANTSRLLHRIWRLVGRKSKREGTRRRKNTDEFSQSRSPRCLRRLSRRSEVLDLGSGLGTADDTSGRVKRRRSERDGKSWSSPPGARRRKVYRKDIREAGRPAGESSRRARDRDQLAPLPSLLPTIKHHQHRLVRGFCAVATECRLHVSTVLEE